MCPIQYGFSYSVKSCEQVEVSAIESPLKTVYGKMRNGYRRNKRSRSAGVHQPASTLIRPVCYITMKYPLFKGRTVELVHTWNSSWQRVILRVHQSPSTLSQQSVWNRYRVYVSFIVMVLVPWYHSWSPNSWRRSWSGSWSSTNVTNEPNVTWLNHILGGRELSVRCLINFCASSIPAVHFGTDRFIWKQRWWERIA